MNRIDAIFQRLRGRSEKALMPFITAGDPDLETTGRLLAAMQRAGVHVCELGMPFSDPIADGPVIQASMSYALDQRVRPGQILEAVSRWRDSLHIGLVAMVSYSIVNRLGPASFVRDACAAGLDGLIVPDLPLEQSAPLRQMVVADGLVQSMLIAPTTDESRAEQIAQASSGFVYLLGHSGLTGERTAVASDLRDRIGRLRKVTKLPIAVGFGISDRQQVHQVVQIADAAIVGSSIMRRIAERRDEGPRLVEHIERFVEDLVAGLNHNQ